MERELNKLKDHNQNPEPRRRTPPRRSPSRQHKIQHQDVFSTTPEDHHTAGPSEDRTPRSRKEQLAYIKEQDRLVDEEWLRSKLAQETDKSACKRQLEQRSQLAKDMDQRAGQRRLEQTEAGPSRGTTTRSMLTEQPPSAIIKKKKKLAGWSGKAKALLSPSSKF